MSGAAVSFPAEAQWAGAAHPFDLHEAYLDFRSPALLLEAPPGRAELLITADSRYRLWINASRRCPPAPHVAIPGSKASTGSTSRLFAGRQQHRFPQIYQPGYSHFAYTHRAATGLLAHLLCDGRTQLVTGSHWRTRRNPSFLPLVPRVSIYGSGEDRDLRLDDNWWTVEYDAGDWSIPRITASLGGYPWLELNERITPLLVERELPLTLVEVRTGQLDESIEPHVALCTAWQCRSASRTAHGRAGCSGGSWYRLAL